MTAVSVQLELDLFAPAEPLDRLAAYWHEANQRWFGAQLEPVPIVAGLEKTRLTMGRAGFDWSARRYQIEIHSSLVDRLDEPGMYRETTDVLLHEMIHQYLDRLRPTPGPRPWADEPGHGPTFTAHCNRIGAVLGLAEVAARKPRGQDVPLSRHWPHCVRPDSNLTMPPKWDTQLATVRELVRAGVGCIPGRPVDERLIAHYLGVSPVTVHRKLCVLERRGLLIRKAGKFWTREAAAS